MTSTPNTSEKAQIVARSIRRTVLSAFMFSAVLASALGASSTLLLPRFTQVEVGGQMRDLAGLRSEHARLTAQIADLEGRRRQFLTSVNDPTYQAFVASKDAGPAFLDIFAAVRDAAATFPGNGGPAIVFESMTLSDESKTLVLQGEVRNVDSRSMTVLAQFAELVGSLPFVQSAATPTFTREFRESHGFFSPFIIRLVLK